MAACITDAARELLAWSTRWHTGKNEWYLSEIDEENAMNVLEFDELSRDAEDARAAAVRKYLTNNGWRYTCDHPGSVWLWTIAKDLSTYDAQLYAVNEEIAIRFQRYWELEAQHFNAHEADCPIFETFDWDDCTCMPEEGVENDTAALDGDV